MKLSKREKILIIILLLLIASFILYKVIPLKTDFNLNGVKESHQNVLMNYEAMSQNIKLIKIYEEKEKILLQEIEELNILTAINQEEQIELINKLLRESNIKANKITFSETMLVSDEREETITKDSETEKLNKRESSMISMSANIQFVTNYNDMLLFINKLQSNSYNIAINSIQSLYADDGSVNCTMDISFYALGQLSALKD